MRRVLFVDDERNLLSGLRRLLRPKRNVWEMSFVLGPELALQEMESAPPDVVVSDMKMPGMDGAQLLAEVRRRYPTSSRMILSGHAEVISAVSVVRPMQHCLAKPCDMDSLVPAIERVLALNDLVTDDALAARFGGFENLPDAPEIYERMLEVVSDPLSAATDIVPVIEADPETRTDVLQKVNSSVFGLPTRIDTIDRAVQELGLDTVQGLALAGNVYRAAGNDPAGFDSEALHRRGLLVARITSCLARLENMSRSEVNDAFFAGLLYDTGLVWLIRSRPEGWREFRRSAPASIRDLADAEEAAFGVTAARSSAFLLGYWGFPESIISAIADRSVEPETADGFGPLLMAARHRVLFPQTPLSEAGLAPVTEDRLCRWESVCSEMAKTDVRASVLPVTGSSADPPPVDGAGSVPGPRTPGGEAR